MNIVISPETQKLLEARMKEGDYTSPDDLIRAALETMEGEPFEDFDPALQADIEQSEQQAERGEGIPVDDAFKQLRRKHFGA
jgi:Arc/MetJ-type ribon-helix-helix transcriptional regulator